MSVVAEQPSGGDRAAPDVAGEVAQGGLALADVLELDIPLLGGTEDLSLCKNA